MSKIRLIHYSPHEGMAQLDPAYAGTSRTASDMDRQIKSHPAYVPHTWFYKEDTPHEFNVANLHKNAYAAEVNDEDIYDAGTDPLQIHKGAAGVGYEKWMNTMRDAKDRGFLGVTNSAIDKNPGRVQWMHPIAVKPIVHPMSEDRDERMAKFTAYLSEQESTDLAVRCHTDEDESFHSHYRNRQDMVLAEPTAGLYDFPRMGQDNDMPLDKSRAASRAWEPNVRDYEHHFHPSNPHSKVFPSEAEFPSVLERGMGADGGYTGQSMYSKHKGRELFLKTERGEMVGPRGYRELSDNARLRHPHLNELLAARVGHLGGAGDLIPPIKNYQIQDEDGADRHYLVTPRVSANSYSKKLTLDSGSMREVDPLDWHKMAVFDHVIRNTDRHEGNALHAVYKDGAIKPVLIDHSLSFNSDPGSVVEATWRLPSILSRKHLPGFLDEVVPKAAFEPYLDRKREIMDAAAEHASQGRMHTLDGKAEMQNLSDRIDSLHPGRGSQTLRELLRW